MASVFRLVALGLLCLALVLHLIGFSTNYWVSASLDSPSISQIINANSHGSSADSIASKMIKGLDINLGLWKFCMSADMAANINLGMNFCHDQGSSNNPDWMKAVQALGILSAMVAVVGVVGIIYSIRGDSKGDRARLIPYINAAICFGAGLLLLIAVIVFGAEYTSIMQDQESVMGTSDPSTAMLFANIKEHTHLGYSFALETIAALLFILVSVFEAVPALRGWEPASVNMAI